MHGGRALAMSADAVWAAIDEERRRLVELVERLSDDDWSRPSLCADWQVRDVVAHLALAQAGLWWSLAEMIRARGNLDRMVSGTARRHARRPADELIGQVRSMIGSRRRAPGVSHFEPLIDVLVHTQDIAIPLGREHAMPVESAAVAASRIWTMPWPLSKAFNARSRLRGLRLCATDTDWSVGEGAPVEGPIRALLLLLAGRGACRDELSGEGVDRARRAVMGAASAT